MDILWNQQFELIEKIFRHIEKKISNNVKVEKRNVNLHGAMS